MARTHPTYLPAILPHINTISIYFHCLARYIVLIIVLYIRYKLSDMHAPQTAILVALGGKV